MARTGPASGVARNHRQQFHTVNCPLVASLVRPGAVDAHLFKECGCDEPAANLATELRAAVLQAAPDEIRA